VGELMIKRMAEGERQCESKACLPLHSLCIIISVAKLGHSAL